MKKIFTLLVALAATTVLWAARFEVDGLFYNILADKTNEVEVTYQYEWWSSDNYASLTTVTIPETVTHNGTTYSVTSIGDEAFYRCSSLTSITIPNSVTSIGYEAFGGCSYLKSITIGESVTSIGYFAFAGCHSLDSIVWNAKKYQDDGILQIADQIFNSVSEPLLSMTSIIFGDAVEHIPTGMCVGMPNLTTVLIGKNVQSIGDWAFDGCISLTSITIPNNVTSIGGWAFRGCTGFQTITLPESLISIGIDAFSNCRGLTGTITIPDNVTEIGSYAFWDCCSMDTVIIGKSVKYIGVSPFSLTSSLKVVELKSTTPPNFDPEANMLYVFDGAPLKQIFIPCGTTGAYKNHEDWSYWGDLIQEASYNITVRSADESKGRVVIDQNSVCDGAQVRAIPNEGYSFIQWTDGNTDNPRRFEITCDTTFTAIFDKVLSGQCGDSLYWHYTMNELIITGTGVMWDECPWAAYMGEITNVSLPTGITYIGNNAFQDCVNLQSINLPHTLNTIGDFTFNGCRNLIKINCYAPIPPYAETTSFSNYSAQLFAPCDNLDAYKYDMVFGQFYNFECMGTEAANIEGVDVVPSSNDVTITWPTDADAETYTLEITKDDVVFCKLVFNANGQLLNIAFAPGRNGNKRAKYVQQTTNGYRFTVTNLEEGTPYGYTIESKDDAEQIINSYSGEFVTEGLTTVDNLLVEDTSTHKLLHNGQLLIIRDGKTYNVMGTQVD